MEENFEYYENNNGDKIPRVTSIIKMLGGNLEGLCTWANSLGFRRVIYKDIMGEYTAIGNITHSLMEDMVNDNKLTDIDNLNVSDYVRESVNNAYSGFRNWFQYLTSNNDVKFLETEKKLIGSKFAGTMDFLVEINGKIYVGDYKTSSKFSITQFIQGSAYMKLLKELCNIEVDGVVIVKASRKDDSFIEYLINNDETGGEFLRECGEMFDLLLEVYNKNKYLESLFNKKKLGGKYGK